MPPEKKKLLTDYAKIASIWALIGTVWGGGYYVGGIAKTIGIKFDTYDAYDPRIKALEGFRENVERSLSFKPSKNYPQLKTK